MERKHLAISHEMIQNILDDLAHQINNDYKTTPGLVCICVLNGAYQFFSDLTKRLDPLLPIELEFIKLSSYGNGTESSNEVKLDTKFSTSLNGKDVLIIEDIVDTGNSMVFLKKYIEESNYPKPRSIKICAFINKLERRITDLHIDYYGIKQGGFVIGYGMDYAGKYRHLKDVYTLEMD